MATSMGKSLIVHGDRTVLLEVEHPDFKEVRDGLMAFAELKKSPEYIHTYRITALSLWNAAASGLGAKEIIDFLQRHAKYPVPTGLRREIDEFLGRYGKLKLVQQDGNLELVTESREILEEILGMKMLREHFLEMEPIWREGQAVLRVKKEHRGQLKVALIKIGYPVEDNAGYRKGAPLDVGLSDHLPEGEPFALRKYQEDAVEAFYAGGQATGGSGVVVLPCGAGKTIVGIGVLERVGSQALVLSTNITALRQWKRELLEKTKLDESLIGEYSGEEKQIRPITLTTYQMLTYRKNRCEEFLHFKLFTARDWGLIIYDEVHLLPAPVFRFTAEIQATRRLGLTATLVREDGREDEVFSLIGPRKYDMPWRSLEEQGWIAEANCVEIRVDMDRELASQYAGADTRGKFRLASENDAKQSVVKALVERHRADRVLVIGQYLDQLRGLRLELSAPLITGKTPNSEREELYSRFRDGDLPLLIVSKVGNFAVDLPDANVAIQVSGTFGSRQEEAQRLGRILRPKKNGGPALFYSVVTRGTRDQDFAEKRQLFLTEQGYHYEIRDGAAGNGDIA